MPECISRDIIKPMVVSIELAPQTESRLRRQAEAVGKDMATYVAQIVEQAASRASLDEVLKPLRKQFDESGESDQKLISDITAAQAEYRAEKSK
jgi:hypothetical protein